MNTIKITICMFSLVLAAASLSCNKNNPAEPVAQPKVEEHEEPGGKSDGHAEEKGEAKEPSDLDRPVKELLALTCEHNIKTFECAECRYETGFVRAPSSLVEGGLIKTVAVERQKVAAPIVLTGEIRFDERRVGHLNSSVEGIIKKVSVALGEKVKKRQALVEIESIEVGEAQSAYLEAKGLLDLANRNFERISELRKEKISSEKEYHQAKQELDAAEIRVEGAFGKLTRLGMDPAEARALTSGNTHGRLVLRAPMGGTVLEMHGVPGEVAKTEESLVTVGDNMTVWVWADLYEQDIATVKRVQAVGKLEASVLVKAYPDEEFPGIVDLVSPSMDESSRTVKVRVEVKNPDGRLLAGMFATVKVFLPGNDEALAIPREAVLEDEGRSFVFVHDHDDYYVRRPVVLGRTWAGWVEAKQGLEAAQKVVAGGAFLMKSDVLRSKMGAGCAD
ncbi:MAG TPA: efflux RND transporter periplasmic adaptor subunit [bacterium]|nr:efflux RND transporter periplasmic adaptor subunit [bacterium]